MGNQIDTLSQEIVTQINTVKSGLADVITAKGVETASNATFATMQTNIANIPVGGGLNPGDKISAQDLTFPQPIWQSPDYSRPGITTLFKDTDGYVYKVYNLLIKINFNGTLAWDYILKSSVFLNWIIKDGENYVLHSGGVFIDKINATTGTLVADLEILNLKNCNIGIADTDGYIIGNDTRLSKINLDLTERFQSDLFMNSIIYSAFFDSVHDVFVLGCNGYLTVVNRAVTARVVDFNVGHNYIYSLLDDGTGYVCGSRLGYLTKVKYDGSGTVFDYNINHSSINKIILESDGYVCLSTNGYVTKISLDGTLMWDTDLSIYGKDTNYLVKADNGYYTTTGSDNLVKLDYAGNIIMGCYIGYRNGPTTSSTSNNGINSDIIVESDGLVLPSYNGRLTKVPFDPKYTYNSEGGK